MTIVMLNIQIAEGYTLSLLFCFLLANFDWHIYIYILGLALYLHLDCDNVVKVSNWVTVFVTADRPLYKTRSIPSYLEGVVR